jgi:hypothetical protein
MEHLATDAKYRAAYEQYMFRQHWKEIQAPYFNNRTYLPCAMPKLVPRVKGPTGFERGLPIIKEQ